MAVSQKSLHSINTKQVSTETLTSIETHLNRGIEIVWLTAAFLVPLIVLSDHDFSSFTELPKITLMRSLAGTGLILWLMATAVGIAKNSSGGTYVPALKTVSLRRWMVARPIETAAALILIVTAISAVLSIQPLVSALGAEWGRDGYDLHTTTAYIAIFFLAASRIRSRSQFIRLWATISIAGLIAALIGIAQHFALAPFGISGTYQHQRVTGTVGNPLFLGSLLTVTLPMGVSLALAGATNAWRHTEKVSNGKGRQQVKQNVGTWFSDARLWWGVLALIVFVHTYAALLTATRGPWIGMAVGMFVLLALTFKVNGLKLAALTAISVTAGISVALLIAVGPASSGVESFALSEQQQLFNELATKGLAADSIAPTDASSVIGKRGQQGTIEARLKIWEAAGAVVSDRPVLPESNNYPWLVRQLFGHGPDTFRFVFPTKAPAEMMGSLTSAAHNDLLNRLVEIGLAGLLAYALMIVAAVFVIWRLVTREVKEHSIIIALLAIGGGAAIAGRLLEQMSGVAEVSDTTVIWLVLAMLSAAYTVTLRTQREARTESGDSESLKIGRGGITVPAMPPAFAFSVIAVGVVIAGYFIWAHNINLLRSDVEFRNGEKALATDVDQALAHMERSVALNPGVEDYQHARAEILQARAELNAGISMRSEWIQEAYDAEAKAYSFNPTSRAANFELAFASWQLAQLGDREKALETVETYERLLKLAPEHPLVIQRLEQLKLAVGSNLTR